MEMARYQHALDFVALFLADAGDKRIRGNYRTSICGVAHDDRDGSPRCESWAKRAQQGPRVIEIAGQRGLNSHANTACGSVHAIQKRGEPAPDGFSRSTRRGEVTPHARLSEHAE